MIYFKDKKVLVLAPHIDDMEYGCGGTINKILSLADVYYVSFSFAEKSLPKDFSKLNFKNEMFDSAEVLGFKIENIINKNYEVREFPSFRQDILEDLIIFKGMIKPDIIFVPNTLDNHQDHEVISKEAIRAFKDITILGYESIRNNKTFNADIYVKLTESNINTKINAINCYKSQKARTNRTTDILKTLAKYRGFQIDTEYAEAFEAIRIVL